MGLLNDYMAQVQDYKKAGSIGTGLLADRPDLSLGKSGLLSQMQSAEAKYMERVNDPLPYYRQNPAAQGLLSVSPELDLLDIATGGGKATFIGQMAKTFNKKALEMAKTMSSKGATRDEIWKATGKLNAPTYKDVDGHWKQEISDEGYQYIEPESLNNSLSGIDASTTAELNMIREASDDDLAQLAELVGFDGSPSEYQTEAIRNIYESMNDITRGKFMSYDVNKHPEFSAAYPKGDLATIQYKNSIGFDDSVKGAFNPVTGNTILKTGEPTTRSTMAHERQHYIQEQEGFAKGGSPSSPFEHGERDKLLRSMIEKLKRNPSNKDVNIDDIVNHAKRLVDGPDGRASAYRNLAGEAEARNVQARLPMSMNERVAKAPWETLDVPERGLLVRGSTKPAKGLLGI
jgi:hypothetical protein